MGFVKTALRTLPTAAFSIESVATVVDEPGHSQWACAYSRSPIARSASFSGKAPSEPSSAAYFVNAVFTL
jgi:hypothetical protein